MFHVVELLCAPRVPHVAVLALISIGFAGCSADMSTRLSQDSFSNPFTSQPEATASVPAPVERRELPQYARPQTQSPQYQSSALPPPTVSAPQSYPSTGNGVSGGGRGLSSYAPPAQPQLENTGTVPQHSVAAAHGPAPRSTTIIVGNSDTLDILSRRYNVSPIAILQANVRGTRALWPRQQLIIPRPTTAAAARRAGPLPPRQRRRRFTSSIAATLCSASRVAITYRSPNSQKRTISIGRRSSSPA